MLAFIKRIWLGKDADREIPPFHTWLVYYKVFGERSTGMNIEGSTNVVENRTGGELVTAAHEYIKKCCLNDTPEFTRIVICGMSRLD